MSYKLLRTTAVLVVMSVVLTTFPFISFADDGIGDFYMFEGEDGIYGIEGGGDLLTLTEHEQASGGIAVTGKKSCLDPENLGYIPLKFEFEATEDATYTIWYRTRVFSSGADSAWFSLDDEPFSQVWIAQQDENYTWFTWKTVELKKGKHTLNFAIREYFFTLDKVIITSEQTYVPLGLGEEPKPFEFGENKEETWNLITKYLPPYTPTYDHPRVMINKDDLPSIRANLKCEEHIDVYNQVVEFSKLETGGKYQGDNNYNVAVSYIEANAFLYLMEGKSEYARKAIDGLFNFYATYDPKATSFQYRSAGYEAFITAIVYDWCYPYLTDDEKKAMISRVILDATLMEVGWPPIKQSGANDGHDSEFQIMRDLFSFAIAVYEDYPDFYNIVAGKIFSEYVPKRNYYYEDSVFHSQGDSYGMYRYTAEMYMTYLLDGMGAENLIHPNQHLMGYHFIYRRRPDGAHMSDADMYNIPLSGYISAEVSFLAGNYYNDPYLRNEFYRGDWKPRNNTDNLSPVLFLALNKPAVGVESYEELPLTMYGGDKHGVMTARTSWDEGIESNTMVVSMKIIEFITRSHTHLDSGNFEIYYKGSLALDSGVYNGLPYYDDDGKYITSVGSGSVHDMNYHHRTIAHNAMLVFDPDEVPIMGEANDGGQRTLNWLNNTDGYHDVVDDPEFDYGEVLARDYGEDMNKPSYTYLEGDLTKAYTDKVSDYSRAFMFFNFFDEVYPGALIVFDRVESSDATFKKSWLLHSQEEPVVEDNKITIRRTQYGYNGRLINETLLPKADNRVFTKIGGEGKEYWVNGKNYKAVVDSKGYENGNWRVELSPQKESEHDYFLNVLQVSDNTLNPEPLESVYLETDDLIGVQIKDRVAYFGKDKEKTFKTLKIKSEESEYSELSYVVTGLSEGVWKVLDKSGKEIKEARVAENTGTVSFTAPAGEYTLKPTPQRISYTKSFNILDGIVKQENKALFKYNGYYKTLSSPIEEVNGSFYLPVADLVSYTSNTMKAEGDILTIETGNGSTEFSISNDLKNINGMYYADIEDISKPLEMKYSYNPISNILSAESTLGGALIIFNSGEEGVAEIRDVKWSDAMSHGNGYQSVDGENSTAWISSGDQYITYELKKEEEIYAIKAKWAQGNARIQYFDIEVSEDGESFTTLFEGSSSGETLDFETYEITPSKAKFVRIDCHENSLNDKNNLIEIQILTK